MIDKHCTESLHEPNPARLDSHAANGTLQSASRYGLERRLAYGAQVCLMLSWTWSAVHDSRPFTCGHALAACPAAEQCSDACRPGPPAPAVAAACTLGMLGSTGLQL